MKRALGRQMWGSIVLMGVVSSALSQVPLNQSSYVRQEKLVETGGPEAVEKAAFFFYREIAEMESTKPGSGALRLSRVLKLDEKAAQRFSEYMQEAVSAHDQYSKSLVNRICSNRSNLGTPEAYGAAMTALEKDLEAREVQLAKGSSVALSSADKFVVDAYVSATLLPGLTFTRTDYYKRMKETGEPAELFLRNLCDRSNL